MIELKHISIELERAKAEKGGYGKWGFTVYRTDSGTNARFKDYIKHLRIAMESKIYPDENTKAGPEQKETDKCDKKKTKTDDEKKIEAQGKINKRIKMSHQLYVVEDPAIKGFTTAQVRQHHKWKIQKYIHPELFENEGMQEQLPTPPTSSPRPPDDDGEDNGGNSDDGEDLELAPPADEEEEERNGKLEKGKGRKAKKTPAKPPRKPQEEKRNGHVWQDYFIHVNDDVMDRFRIARWKQEQLAKNARLYPNAADPDETRVVAIVGEAERSDYRLRRFYCETHPIDVPEYKMDWQYVEVQGLSVLYDRLSRRPLGQAQSMADEEEARERFGSDDVDGTFRGRPLNEFGLRLEAEDHGPWYEMFCSPPCVSSG